MLYRIRLAVARLLVGLERVGIYILAVLARKDPREALWRYDQVHELGDVLTELSRAHIQAQQEERRFSLHQR